jgi:threonine dehydrogenase-like Zn-dependent dehydrogenase
MKALMVEPLKSAAPRLEEIREPAEEQGEVLVSAVALGICGTDRDIIQGKYGEAPPGHKRLVIGHESLGMVEDAPAGSELRRGDLIVPSVRLPDPLPCECCAAGEWDRCMNGEFTEHGIKGVDGFGRERYRVPSKHLIAVGDLGALGVLVEPASVVAKAWEDVQRIGQRACWSPRRALVTGAGPVGLLAALFGVHEGFEVHVLDHATGGPKPRLVADLGAVYHSTPDKLPGNFDAVIECTGAAALIVDAPMRTSNNAVICLLGVAPMGTSSTLDVAAFNDRIVLGNRVVVGSVNANRRHYVAARDRLASADRRWLSRLITRRVPLAEWETAFEKRADDVKTIITFPPFATISGA